MTHLRMPANAVQERSGLAYNDGRRLHRDGALPYFFTQSQWAAIAFASTIERTSFTVAEGDYVDPWRVFPERVMKSVDYAMKFGVLAHVTEYEFVDVLAAGAIKAGAVLELYDVVKDMDGGDKPRSLGFYAVQYARNT